MVWRAASGRRTVRDVPTDATVSVELGVPYGPGKLLDIYRPDSSPGPLPTVLLWHGTFTINSLSHVYGTRRYETSPPHTNPPKPQIGHIAAHARSSG